MNSCQISNLNKELKKSKHHLIQSQSINHKDKIKKDILSLLNDCPLDISALNQNLILAASKNVFLFYILRNKELDNNNPEHKNFLDLKKGRYYRRIAEAIYFDYLWIIHDKYETFSFYQCCEMCNMDPELIHSMFHQINKKDINYMIERYKEIHLN